MNDRYTISAGELTAEILAPESPEYGRTRFNHSAFVPDVIYKGVHFGRPEMLDPDRPTTKGAGLCCEIQCPDVETSVPVGGEYLKPGVGYVTRTENPWRIYGPEPTYRPLETVVTAQRDRVLFVTETDMVAGYAYRECRRLLAEDGRLTLSVHFENQGEKPMAFAEYCHNFISLGDLQTSPKLHLVLPCVAGITLDPEKSHMRAEEGGVSWLGVPGVFFNVFQSTRRAEGPAWRLTHEDSPVAISETVDFEPVKLTVWGLEHVVSPEVFTAVTLQPGESADWTRVWRFEA